MAFKLMNAPATFCTLMNKALKPFLDHFAVVYLDDIVVYSKKLEEHVGHLREDPRCEKAFNQVKQAMMSEPVLVLLDFAKTYELCTDASNYAIGEVLIQDGHATAFDS
ncbi:uncharacterized protein LOC108465564 [Gossypium arboreum]|uniref:uncharacterized protein LOC108465564 n=1 Tax=Gossypium arboreum TaxID=29729 RepID=UPI0008191A95|nr:uncharacterized protein LOC108465564 [Gossypium arboreum]